MSVRLNLPPPFSTFPFYQTHTHPLHKPCRLQFTPKNLINQKRFPMNAVALLRAGQFSLPPVLLCFGVRVTPSGMGMMWEFPPTCLSHCWDSFGLVLKLLWPPGTPPGKATQKSLGLFTSTLTSLLTSLKEQNLTKLNPNKKTQSSKKAKPNQNRTKDPTYILCGKSLQFHEAKGTYGSPLSPRSAFISSSSSLFFCSAIFHFLTRRSLQSLWKSLFLGSSLKSSPMLQTPSNFSVLSFRTVY